MSSPVTTDPEGGVRLLDEVPPEMRPPKRMPKWPFVLVGFLFALGIAVAVAWPIELPYYALSPGPVYDVADFVHVAEPVEPDPPGEMYFLTVSLDETNLLEYVGAWLDPRVDLRPREVIRPPGVSPEQLRRQNLDLMEQSKRNAIFVALNRLGYEATFSGKGAQVIEIIPGSAAEGVLEVGDVITAVDGTPIRFSTDAVDAIGGRPVGDVVTLTVLRPKDESQTEFDELEFTITLGPHQDDPNRGMVGVLLQTFGLEVEFPIDVEIDSQNIGGPSAGMMFTLEIMDLLTEEPMTKGHRVAGTGTIDEEGDVGPIGGIRQKVFGAIDAGAEYILVPSENYPDALGAAGDDITVVEVDVIEDALAFLDTLEPTAAAS